LLTRTDHQIERDSPTPRLVLRGGVLLGAGVLVCALAGWPRRAGADDTAPTPSAEFVSREFRDMARRLDAANGESAVLKIQLDRANAVQEYSARYRIPADLSAAIYDIALSEGIDPAMAFQLVKVESNFKQTARSSESAIGLTQLRLPTARSYVPDVTEQALLGRELNLRIGFRYIKDLITQFDGNVQHALLAYNRGPTTVANILAQGGDPRNGYARKVLKGDPRNANVPTTVN
jgi:soluble lytic murein transglycosylase-like protein